MKLPVYGIENELLGALRVPNCSRTLLKAPTGSGKSTAVPQMIVDSGLVEGLIVVVQPRRIAARMLARRVASIRGGAVGAEVGYVVRFDKKMGAKTRIVFVTDGVLESWLEDGMLENVGAIIFDEFHERRLASDVSLALAMELQKKTRQDLKIVVMSATLELEGLAAYLDEGAAQLTAEGRTFPVEVEQVSAAPIQKGKSRESQVWDRCVSALKESIGAVTEGHVLIFLPGVYEIRRTVDLLENVSWCKGWKICPLYSALSNEKQDFAVVGDGCSKRIIVSTNVAETSLTIDGVRLVIDSGLARVARFDPVRGIDTLTIQKISQASAEQRAGRAGRTASGKCIRLWSAADHARREAFELPEVKRVDLAELLLRLKKRDVLDVSSFVWYEKPSDALLDQADDLLNHLSAVNSEGGLSEIGESMAVLRMHPRYSRLLLAADVEGCLLEAIFIAASVQGEELFLRNGNGHEMFCYADDASDFEGEWRAYQSAVQMQFDPRRCQSIGVLAKAAREVHQSMKQIQMQCIRLGLDTTGEVDFSNRSDAVSRAMAEAFNDQLAVRVGRGNLACKLVGNRKAMLAQTSAVKNAEAFLVTEITEVGARDVQVYLNRCVNLPLCVLKEKFPDEWFEGKRTFYDETSRRVVASEEMRFRDLVLSSKVKGEPDKVKAAELLAERVASGELKLKKWDLAVEQWIARLLCLREWMPELELPGFNEEDRVIAFEQICEGAISYKEIKDREVMPALLGWLSAAQTAAMDHYAPTRIKLVNGREVKLKYELGQPPIIALQVQRLFGVEQTPTIAEGKVKVLVHICAPNQRPWQMTQDLAGFWESGFAQMKKDLAGRYPKHQWEL